jgi:hypothetical protein
MQRGGVEMKKLNICFWLAVIFFCGYYMGQYSKLQPNPAMVAQMINSNEKECFIIGEYKLLDIHLFTKID